MNIPNEFIVGGEKYKVSFFEKSKEIDNNLGDFSNILHEIRLAKSVYFEGEDISLSEDDILKTYLHELGHCFGNYYADDHCEEFACAFSNFMFEYLKSKK